MLLVRDGLDRGVHTLVDAGQGLPEVRGQADRLWLGLVDGTLGGQPLAEAHPSGCRLRHFVGNRKRWALGKNASASAWALAGVVSRPWLRTRRSAATMSATGVPRRD